LSNEDKKPDLANLVAHIAREECRRLHKKRLAGLEEELAALHRRLDEYADRT
jgi:hypothetical protein